MRAPIAGRVQGRPTPDAVRATTGQPEALEGIPADHHRPLLRLRDDLTTILERQPLFEVELPLATVTEANTKGHWRAKAKRAKAQRATSEFVFRGAMRRNWPVGGWLGVPVVVLLTRVSPRPLDDDNAASALKHVRDGVADALGIDDRSERVGWVVTQARGAPAVRVTVYERRQG